MAGESRGTHPGRKHFKLNKINEAVDIKNARINGTAQQPNLDERVGVAFIFTVIILS